MAFTAWTPYRHDFSLTTVSTRLRAVDASSPPFELACLDIQATPVHAYGKGGYYGRAQILFWASVGLAIAYWIVVGLGRIAAAWHRGGSGRIEGWVRIKWAGTVLSSAISGDRLSASPALLRFCKSDLVEESAVLKLTLPASDALIERHHLSHAMVRWTGYGCRTMAWFHLYVDALHTVGYI